MRRLARLFVDGFKAAFPVGLVIGGAACLALAAIRVAVRL